jgi:hypothetical protein
MQVFIDHFFERVHHVMDMLIRAYSKKLWKFIFGIFCIFYCVMVTNKSKNWEVGEVETLAGKISDDVALIKEVFVKLVPKKEFDIKVQSLDAIK